VAGGVSNPRATHQGQVRLARLCGLFPGHHLLVNSLSRL
jgi:hypothetical protein